MKLFIIGAAGRTGQEIVQQALARDHDLTAFVRSPESMAITNDRLTVLTGNAVEEKQLFGAMQNHDAVISALGPREPFKPSSLLRDSALATTQGCDRAAETSSKGRWRREIAIGVPHVYRLYYRHCHRRRR